MIWADIPIERERLVACAIPLRAVRDRGAPCSALFWCPIRRRVIRSGNTRHGGDRAVARCAEGARDAGKVVIAISVGVHATLRSSSHHALDASNTNISTLRALLINSQCPPPYQSTSHTQRPPTGSLNAVSSTNRGKSHSRAATPKLTAALEAERPPVPQIDELLPPGRTQQATTYFDCAKVLARAQARALDEKTFLGGFTNPHTARWAEVIKKYETGKIYLIDTAQFLVHARARELPALKKEMSRAEKELLELQRRQAEYTRLAEASRTRFVAACARRQIAAEETASGLRDELRLSMAQLRSLYMRVARRVQAEPLPSAVAEYRALVAYALEKVEEPAAERQAGKK